ncbi:MULTISPECIES: TIGR02594 family protein [unclassified Bradyrhizobium]|uniref:TIGR02594 family protein n=1 Tax=unclassified Bradyrhizobium TaxID=2631580 RepID=UPI0028EF12EC|nr:MULTISPECIES: TIGR02594 family protein [unclassified Bradyrhizobium]
MVVSIVRRSLHVVALAVCSAAFAASATPASARSHHGSGHHAHRSHGGHHYAKHHIRHGRSYARLSRRVARLEVRGVDDVQANQMMSGTASGGMGSSGGFGDSSVVAEARRYLGGNPTSRASLWCARFMNMVLERTGHHGTGSDLARSFASYGQRVSGPQVGAIAVMSRHGGGHVGVVSGIDAQGNPILISGNNRNRVREAPVSRGRVYAYVMPN